MRKDDRGQLIIAIGVLLAFTLMTIGSNAVDLTYVKKTNSYAATSSSSLNDDPQLFQETLEWALNSGTFNSSISRREAVRRAIIEADSIISEALAPHGIVFKAELVGTPELNTSWDAHRLNITVNITVQDGIDSMQTTRTLQVINLVSDPWPNGDPYHSNINMNTLTYRIPIWINSGDIDRINHPVSVDLDLRGELDRLGVIGDVDNASLTLVEHGMNGSAKQLVPSAYFGDLDEGTLTWVVDGEMDAGTYRYYHIYFRLIGQPGPNVNPDGNLVVYPNGTVTNGIYSINFKNGSHFRLGTTQHGIDRSAWKFVEDGIVQADFSNWTTWEIPVNRNSSVYSIVRSMKGDLTRIWRFYGNSPIIEIRDSWSSAGTASHASFLIRDMGTAMAGRFDDPGDRFKDGKVDQPTGFNAEPPLPNVTVAGNLAYIAHTNGFNYYSYIYRMESAHDVDWKALNGTPGYEIMELSWDHSGGDVFRYHMYMGDETDIQGDLRRQTASLATSIDVMAYRAHTGGVS